MQGRAFRRTASLRRALARMRSDGPAISRAATRLPSAANTGAAMPLAPITLSSLVRAMPSRRMAAISASRPARLVIVEAVKRFGGAALK